MDCPVPRVGDRRSLTTGTARNRLARMHCAAGWTAFWSAAALVIMHVPPPCVRSASNLARSIVWVSAGVTVAMASFVQIEVLSLVPVLASELQRGSSQMTWARWQATSSFGCLKSHWLNRCASTP